MSRQNKYTIIYNAESNYPENVWNEIQKRQKRYSPAYAFHKALSNGLFFTGNKVKTPIYLNKKIHDRISIDQSRYKVFYYKNNVEKFFHKFFGLLSLTIKNRKSNKLVIISDILNLSSSFYLAIFSKIFKITYCTIITDHPKYFNKKSFVKKVINYYIFRNTDLYIVLTRKLTEIPNEHNKPYVIIEPSLNEKRNTIKYNEKSKSVFFSGTMSLENGTLEIIKAFGQIKNNHYKLVLAGNFENNSQDTLIDLIDKTNNVEYVGTLTHSDSLKYQSQAYLLVNPRLSSAEYNMYSFPMKIVEYLSSGTVVLSTKLPSFSDELCKSLILFEEENPFGFAKKLDEVLNYKIEKLIKISQSALDYVNKYTPDYYAKTITDKIGSIKL